jgi:hypothetical protein
MEGDPPGPAAFRIGDKSSGPIVLIRHDWDRLRDERCGRQKRLNDVSAKQRPKRRLRLRVDRGTFDKSKGLAGAAVFQVLHLSMKTTLNSNVLERGTGAITEVDFI